MAKPVVASNLGGPQELVRHGETGFLVLPNDPDALAKAVVTILTDPTLAQQMGEAGYEQAKSRFDAKVNVAQTLAVYKELLG